ncbi:MAG: DUF1573 domain-containing protein [Fimbriiglobus sp.]
MGGTPVSGKENSGRSLENSLTGMGIQSEYSTLLIACHGPLPGVQEHGFWDSGRFCKRGKDLSVGISLLTSVLATAYCIVMRVISLLLLVVSLGSAGAAFYAWDCSRQHGPTGIFAEPFVQDLGVIPQGDVAEASFTITNHHGLPLIIDNTWAFCGCTTPTVEKNNLAPGESTIVRSKWSTKGLRGSQSTEVTVNYHLESPQPEKSTPIPRCIQLGLKGVIDARLKVSQEWLEVSPDSSKPYIIEVIDTGEPKLDSGPILGTVSSHPAFRVTILSRTQIEIRIDPKTIDDVGSMPAVTIMTSNPHEPNLKIPIVVGSRKVSSSVSGEKQ